MILRYGKNNIWEIHAPNTCALFTDMMKSETNKNYITLNQGARILYSLSQSVVSWNENDYKNFIGSLKQETMSFYTTKTQNNKGNGLIITRENINFIKNDLEFLLKLFSTIIPLMILDKKFKLFVE